MKVTKPVRVGFDPHGGDPDEHGNSPLERNIAALATVSREFDSEPVTFKVTGRQDEIEAELKKHDHADNIKLVHVPDVFAMDGKLGDYKGKTTAISKLAEMLKTDEVDVILSNGNTTATVTYPTLKGGRISKGVMPSIVTQIPRGPNNFYFLVLILTSRMIVRKAGKSTPAARVGVQEIIFTTPERNASSISSFCL